MTIDETALMRRGAGKWGQAGVPHKGWECIDEDDIGPDERETCEMCESKSIRYVQIMRHDDYPEQLRCGCICAGHMAEDLVGAQSRERGMRNAAGRKLRAMRKEREHVEQPRLIDGSRPDWKISAKGNRYATHADMVCGVYPKRGGYHCWLKRSRNAATIFLPEGYDTEEAACEALWDRLLAMVG